MAMTAYVTTLCRRPPPALSLAHGLAQSLDSLSSLHHHYPQKKHHQAARVRITPSTNVLLANRLLCRSKLAFGPGAQSLTSSARLCSFKPLRCIRRVGPHCSRQLRAPGPL